MGPEQLDVFPDPTFKGNPFKKGVLQKGSTANFMVLESQVLFGFYLHVNGLGSPCANLNLQWHDLMDCLKSPIGTFAPLKCWALSKCDHEVSSVPRIFQRAAFLFSLNKDAFRVVQSGDSGPLYAGFFPEGFANPQRSVIFRVTSQKPLGRKPRVCLRACNEPLGKCVNGQCRCINGLLSINGTCLCKCNCKFCSIFGIFIG